MKTTVIAIIAMVLMAFCVMPVAAANADNDLYTSKYKPTDPGYPTTGGVVGAVRCHNNLLTTGVTITDPAGIVSPLDLRADGTFDLLGLAPGKYVINIADGNGGQPEQSSFTVVAGQIAFLEKELLGHAVSPADNPEVADVITVINATYGMQRVVIDRPAVPGTPAIPEVNHTVTHPAQTHQDYEAGHVHAKTVGGHSQHDFIYNFQKYQIVQNNEHYDAFIVHGYMCAHKAQMVTIVDVPAHTHLIVDSPAVPAVPAIPELSHIEGSFADVRADVQAVIDGGAREFLFDNARQGIYSADGTTLLRIVADPAVGQVKSVVINVEINGALKTINTMEYEVITI